MDENVCKIIYQFTYNSGKRDVLTTLDKNCIKKNQKSMKQYFAAKTIRINSLSIFYIKEMLKCDKC